MIVAGLVSAMAFVLAGAAAAQDLSAAPPPPPAPEIILQTSMGDITVALDTVGAPITSAHFLKNVRAKHYDGAAFYRIEPGFLIQLGDSDVKGIYRKPKFPPIPLETATTKHAKYKLGLAHGDDPNSGQTTFYIDLADNPHLNAAEGAAPNTTGFTAFGKVTAGFEVVDAIAAVERAPTGGPFPGKLPLTPVFIKKAVVVSPK
jgi:peptidyl-prolyl cis-trans isomerase A (cyclophilin A)